MAEDNYLKSSRPLYYGSGSKSSRPAYYGGSSYGQAAYGAYGAYGGVAYGSADGQRDESIVGTITPARMLRVIAQRWILVLVALVIGIAVAFAIYRVSPTVYSATSKFTMEIRHANNNGNHIFASTLDMPDYGSTYGEVFNTRVAEWCSTKVVSQIITRYKSANPTSTISDEELFSTLRGNVKMELERQSRLISISVQNGSYKLAVDLANAYAKAIEDCTEEANKARCDRAVSQIQQQTDKQGRVVEAAQKALLDFRMAHKLDNMVASRDTVRQSLTQTTADILNLESEETSADEWNKVLQQIQQDPDKFGNLPIGVPRSSEISSAYQEFQKSQLEKNAMLARFTASHPEVKAKEKEADIYRQQFCDVVARAYATAQGNLAAIRNQLTEMRAKRNRANAELTTLNQKIVEAQSGLDNLERTLRAESALYEEMRLKLAEARVNAEADNAIVRQVAWAEMPKSSQLPKPISPKPMVIFPVGAVIGLACGLFFVLALDHLEDTVIGIADIEQRLSLKVLAVLPHVRRKKRAEVAKFVVEDKYSQFAEAVAGLRNLLDSPRYAPITQVLLCVSTQPGEGKTISSTSIALSHAQAGKKTLLIDFDLRRPRHAKIWGLELTSECSLSHVLQAGGDIDFSKLINKSGVENLDVIASLSPDGVNPSSIMGSQVVSQFIQWARVHYERIVIDAPPFGVVGDVTTLSSVVDSVIILCCPDRSRARPIRHATRHLTEAGATVIGVVVNDVDMSGGSAFMAGSKNYGYGYGYGYGGYGYGYGRSRKRKGKHDDSAAEASKQDNSTSKPADGNVATADKPSDKKTSSSHINPRAIDFSDDD